MATHDNSGENQLSGKRENKDLPNTSQKDRDHDAYKLSPEFSSKLNINQPETIEIGSDSDNDNHTKLSAEQCKSNPLENVCLQRGAYYASLDRNIEKHGKKDNNTSECTVKGNSTPYKCDCGECFEKSTELAAHRRWTCKLAEKKVQCAICKSSFAHEHGLRRHMKHTHHGVFNCSKCSLRFHNLIRLSRHWMETHYDENKSDDKLKCFLCGDDSFPSKFDLESHLLNHKYSKTHAKKIITTSNTRTAQVDSSQTSSETVENSSKVETDIHRAENKKRGSVIPSPQLTEDDNVGNFTSPSQSISNCVTEDEPQVLHIPQPNTADSTSTSVSHDPHHHFPPGFFHPRFPFPVTLPPFRPPFTRHPPFHHPPHHHPPHHHPPHHHSDHHHSLHHHHPLHPFYHCLPDKEKTLSSSNENQETQLHSPYLLPPQWPLRRRHHEHHKKMKWKKYFKNVMSQYLSPWEMGQYAAMASQSDLHDPAVTAKTCDVPFSRGVTVATETVQNPNSFQMACKFFGQILERGTAVQHRLHDCPALSFSFKCNVCGKAFKKYHKLIQHRVHQGHFDNTAANESSRSGPDSVTNLQNKLNAVGISGTPPVSVPHGLQSSDRVTANTTHHDHVENPSIIISGQKDSNPNTPLLSYVKTEPEDTESQNIMEMGEVASVVIDKEHCNTAIGQREQMSQSSSFVCCVCRCVLDSAALLSIHLHEHITHVTAVVKVQEWKKKSSKYFFDRGTEESSVSTILSGTDSPLDEASTTTESSFQDASSSALLSNNSSLRGNPSEIVDAVQCNEKWLKPHCKKKKKCGKKMFPCEFCDEAFSFKKALHFHMKEKHGQKRPYLECPVCQRKFSWKSRGQFYERHLSSHYGIKIFKHKCEVCDKTFLEKGKLQAHVMAKHTADLSHICQLCGKGYASKSSLTRHLRQHTGEKPHQCEVCTESFLEKRELLRHMAVHTGTPAFVCPHCEQGFTLKTSLDMHVKRKHQ